MINYKLLDDSISFYTSKGYNRIEAPWTTSEYINNITAPKGVTQFQFKHNDKCLVASGEQSFLYLYLKGFLPKGKYQTTTPCFRMETFDLTHTKYFIKNELIITDDVNLDNLLDMVSYAKTFYSRYLNNVTKEKTENGYDLVCKGVELGSYGIRRCEFLEWIYGTGCAEPRLSTVIKLQNKRYGLS